MVKTLIRMTFVTETETMMVAVLGVLVFSFCSCELNKKTFYLHISQRYSNSRLGNNHVARFLPLHLFTVFLFLVELEKNKKHCKPMALFSIKQNF